jgi:uracil-DNA glycosylase
MIPPVVVGQPVPSKILLIGQAPGPKEGGLGKPFAWTAGKTLFRWFDPLGLSEEEFRTAIYMAAVCRCFPGKSTKGGGDRVPNPGEIAQCRGWLEREFALLEPELVIPVGKLAISQFLEIEKLDGVIGRSFRLSTFGPEFDLIPLPHPSGASTWHRREPGISLLKKALGLIKRHPAFVAARQM